MFTYSHTFVRMGADRFIDSLKNPQIRELVLIKEKSRWRKKLGLFVAEGKKEVEMSLKGGCTILKIYYCSTILNREEIVELLRGFDGSPELIEVSKEVYGRIAYREKTEGMVALGKSKNHSLQSLQLYTENPLILVAEAPEKPGNIGAILRTADAAAIDAVIVADPRTDLYNPNVIRSSLGCLFTVAVGQGSNEEVLAYLKEHNCKLFAAELNASVPYSEADFSGPSAIIVGTESTGLTEDWIQASDCNILIPMKGEIDSMNVSVSAAILIFEAVRQRGR